MLASIAAYGPTLVCVGGMSICFLAMSRMGRHGDPAKPSDQGDRDAELAELREELNRLRAEVRLRSDSDEQPSST